MKVAACVTYGETRLACVQVFFLREIRPLRPTAHLCANKVIAAQY